jgi:hypothetical protein
VRQLPPDVRHGLVQSGVTGGSGLDKVARLLGISATPGGQTGCVYASDV